jgi:protocatechuate 3,4-dioxygenase beta subunit
MSLPDPSRRNFLSAGAVLLGSLGCRGLAVAQTPPPRVCRATEPNIEGPYYRPGAPLRANLVDAGIAGVPLLVGGRVLSADCRSPLAGATLDVWQADGDGHYDNDGSLQLPPGAVRLRGKIRTDARGAFAIQTLKPGRYLNGPTYRPAHIHVKLAAQGHRPITTQLYFPDDPYNATDPFIRKSLIMDVSTGPHGATAQYDFVLVPA